MISRRSWITVVVLSFASIALGNNTVGGGGADGGGGAHAAGGGSLAGGGGSHMPAGSGAAAHAGGVSAADEVRSGALMSGVVSSDALKGATVSHETVEGRPATVVRVVQELPLTDAVRRKLHRKGFYEPLPGKERFFCIRDPTRPLRCFDLTDQGKAE
jgi:hypothetical protein